jgi:hypothetical protein
MSQPNPYAPPGAALQDLPAKAGSALKAVTLGLLVDVGGTTAGGLLLGILYGIWLAASGMSVEDVAAASEGAMQQSWMFWISTAMGLGFSVLGGFVCARIARRNEIKLGAILALLSALLGYLLAAGYYELGTFLSLTLASIGAVIFGAHLGYRKNRGTK